MGALELVRCSPEGNRNHLMQTVANQEKAELCLRGTGEPERRGRNSGRSF